MKTTKAKTTTEISLNTLYRAKSSLCSRLSRLRKYTRSRCGGGDRPTAIQELGVFNAEIEEIEKTYKSMKHRLDNATITVTL